ncbi:hypothetical protein HIM_08494 [Hirsutella minnesotensis 3608]|uniref:GST N-terminal domain-containing protein n=1 Tax=Hirsutella minnesotensis 3608 TaxID=1043627 RepID=A0A0F7ZH69_9HYPO|nr:hypothetical protein HIM_08494 [Hirsutella minnesotensis 3608]
MSTFVLRYFPIKWRAEVVRFLLLASDASFTEEKPAWPEARAQQPVGQLPVLVERDAGDGTEFLLSDSVAIERYLADKYGWLATGGARVTARECQLRNQIEDLYHLMIVHIYGHEAGRPDVQARFDRMARGFVEYHEGVLAENGSNGHYFGGSLTWMDVALYTLLLLVRRPYERQIPGVAGYFGEDKAPGLNKVFETVHGDPLSAGYRATLVES